MRLGRAVVRLDYYLSLVPTQLTASLVGRCFRLQLINTIDSTPTWYPASPPSIVIKVTDLCPSGGSWCNATSTSPNAYVILNGPSIFYFLLSTKPQFTKTTLTRAGLFANFDLAWDSPSDGVQHGIPENFYPTNVSYYGYSVRFCLVPLQLGSAVCCLSFAIGLWCVESLLHRRAL
jgi:EXPB1-like domain 1